jgi:hypothetical protein
MHALAYEEASVFVTVRHRYVSVCVQAANTLASSHAKACVAGVEKFYSFDRQFK